MNEFLTTILPYLKALEAFRMVLKYGPEFLQWGKNVGKRSFYDIDEIHTNILEENLHIGDTIECAGFLSKYSQTFLPMSFEPTIPGAAKEKLISTKIFNDTVQRQMRLKTSWTSLQVPVNIIPSFENMRLCFLYDENFSGFVYPINDGIENPELKNKIMVPQYGKPIPVLIDINKHSGLIDNYVYFKAKIISVPNEFVKYLQYNYSDLLLDHNSNFYNPRSETSTFICLSMVNSSEKIDGRIYQEKIKSAEAQVFTEFHVEGMENYQEKAREIIENSIPDLASKGIRIMTVEGYQASPYVTKGDIRVLYREPNIVGLYTLTDLYDKISYYNTIDSLSKYALLFSRNIGKISLQAVGKKLNTSTDFVFDPTKGQMFDSRGIMPNDKSLFSVDEDIDYSSTIDWYRNSK